MDMGSCATLFLRVIFPEEQSFSHKQFTKVASMGFVITILHFISSRTANASLDIKFIATILLLLLVLISLAFQQPETSYQLVFAQAILIGAIQIFSLYSLVSQAKEYKISLLESINSSWFRGGTFLSLITLLGGNVIGGMFGLSTVLTWCLFWVLSPKSNTVIAQLAILDILLQLGFLICVNYCLDKLMKEKMEALKAVQTSNKHKVSFISKMSHDMKTPLYGILGSIKLLLNSCCEEQQLEILRQMHNCANTLERFISDLLDSTANTKLSIIEKQFNFTESMNCLSKMLNDVAAASSRILSVVIDRSLPEFAYGDMPRIHQIFIHLLNNAIKFTSPSKGIIEITITSGINDVNGDRFRVDFTVRDNGAGMSNEELKILNRILSNPTVNDKEYVGIGLSVVPKIIHTMEGQIVCNSEENVGTTFQGYFYVVNGTEKQKQTLPIPKKKGLVLIVEDNQVNQRLMKHMLDSLGFPHVTAENGQQALELFQLHKSELILCLMDIHMPVMDGITATNKIREMEGSRNSRLPIVAVTAGILDSEVYTLKEAGLDGYLPKPVKKDQLLNCLLQYNK